MMRQCRLSQEESLRLICLGSVYVDRRRANLDRMLSDGQYVRVHVRPKRFPVDVIDWPAAIIHSDRQCLVVNKPTGIPVHPTLDNEVENVLFRLNLIAGVPVYLTHRLDVEAGGLIVFAKTPEFQREFNQLLIDRNVRKCYTALVTSPPDPGWHTHYMEPSKRSPKRVVAEASTGWQECRLRILSVVRAASRTTACPLFEVAIDLKTGRTHQIRAQLAAMGSPIVGDRLYGSQTPYELHGKTLPAGIALFSAGASWPSAAAGRDYTFELSPPWRE